MNGIMYAKGEQIIIVAQMFVMLYIAGHPLFVEKEIMSSFLPLFFHSCSSGRLGVFHWLHLCIVRVIEEIKDLCSLASDSFTFVQPAPETQRVG